MGGGGGGGEEVETVMMKGCQDRTRELLEALNHSKPKQGPSFFIKA